MPFPTYHLIAGLPLLKRRKMFISYAITNILIDVEPGIKMVMYKGSGLINPQIHGLSHTFPLVNLVAFIALLFGASSDVVWGIFIGGNLHVLLDSFVHSDMTPFLFTDWNPMYGFLSWKHTEWLCLGMGSIVIFLVDVVAQRLCIYWRSVKKFIRVN